MTCERSLNAEIASEWFSFGLINEAIGNTRNRCQKTRVTRTTNFHGGK